MRHDGPGPYKIQSDRPSPILPRDALVHRAVKISV